MKIKLFLCEPRQSVELQFNTFMFPGGEQHIRISDTPQITSAKLDHIKVFIRLNQSSDIMLLLMTVDALRNRYSQNIPIDLFIPYLPYARQDRICYDGEAFGLRVIATIINNLSCRSLTLLDVHSDVALELLSAATSINQIDLLSHHLKLMQKLKDRLLVPVAPDISAQTKLATLCERYQLNEFVKGEKYRNPENGLIETVNIDGDVTGKHLLLIDDICDGGGTFIAVAKSLKAQGAQSIQLYVTHGIFSQGLAVFKGYIDTIYTTDAFRPACRYQSIDEVKIEVIEICDSLI